MLAEATRFAVAVYEDEDGNIYTKPIVTWVETKTRTSEGDTYIKVEGYVYNGWEGLVPAYMEDGADFYGINFDVNTSPEKFVADQCGDDEEYPKPEPEVFN